MTDNEIIKAMQCVIGNDVSCSECEYQKALPFPSCRRMCAKNALDLINRQKAKIEEFDGKIIIQQGIIDYQKAEIERLKDKIFVLENDLEKAESLSDALGNDVDIKLNHIYDLEEKLKKAKSEVIKEFAERLNEKFGIADCIVTVDNNGIDELVKEMTGQKMSKDISDFAEKLKAHQITVTVGDRRVDVVAVSVIDFILDEMEEQ